MITNIMNQFWSDESGSVVAAEYLMLGTVVVASSAVGMAEMRNSINDEFREAGRSLREVRQQYSVPPVNTGPAARGGTNVAGPTHVGHYPAGWGTAHGGTAIPHPGFAPPPAVPAGPTWNP